MREIKTTALGHPGMVTTLILLSTTMGLSPTPIVPYPSGCFCSRIPNPAGKLNMTWYNKLCRWQPAKPHKEPGKPFVPCLTQALHSALTHQGNSIFIFDLFMPMSGQLEVTLVVPIIQLPQMAFQCGAYFDPLPGHGGAFWKAEKVLRLIPACYKQSWYWLPNLPLICLGRNGLKNTVCDEWMYFHRYFEPGSLLDPGHP